MKNVKKREYYEIFRSQNTLLFFSLQLQFHQNSYYEKIYAELRSTKYENNNKLM